MSLFDSILKSTGGAPDGLDQARFAAEKAFFVRVENADQADLGKIEPLPKQVLISKGLVWEERNRFE